MAKMSDIDKAIEALEAKRNAYDASVEMAIQALIAQRGATVAPGSGEPKVRKTRKKRGMPASEGL